MRKCITILFCLILAICLNTEKVVAQELLLNPPSPNSTVDFEVQNLRTWTSDPSFGHSPFHQAFIIYGDGNFARIGDTGPGNALEDNLTFSYPYRDMTNNYPVLMRLIERKTGDEPPDDAQIIIGGGSKGLIKVSSASGTIFEPASLGTNPTPISSPMLSFPSLVATGMSHYAIESGGNGRYYIENKGIHVFPIAYNAGELVGDSAAVLLFFYNDDGANFEHYKEIDFSNTTLSTGILPSFTTGTILPNYYRHDFALSSNHFAERMENISQVDVPTLDFFTNITPTVFRNCIQYIIPGEEVTLLNENPDLNEELHLFHFIKANLLNPLRKRPYPFVSVLYQKGVNINTTNYNLDAPALSGLITLPPNISIGGTSYSFADADIISVKSGEPHDPNELIIEDISKDGDEYRVHFRLEFCNDERATDDADGMSLLLESIDGLVNGFNLIECFQDNTAGCGSPICGTCASSPSCETYTVPGVDDKRFCFNFDPGLQRKECGYIRFTSMMSATNVQQLIRRPVIDFCIEFYGGINAPDFCGKNIVLEDTICCVKYKEIGNSYDIVQGDSSDDVQEQDSLKQEVVDYLDCKENPIWKNRDKKSFRIGPCPKFCFCCRWWLCWPLIIISLFSVLYFSYRLFKKK